MALNGTTISKEGLEYLCGLINKIVSSPKDLLNDINLATNTTFSSVRIDSLIADTLQQANTHAEALCNALTKLTCEKTTTQPTLSNSEKNVIYLYSADGNPPFDQYLKISDTELIDMGSTSISLNDYLTVTDAIANYCKKTDFDALKTEVTNIKTDIGNEDISLVGTSVKDAINKLNTNKIGKSAINTTIDSTSTDDTIPSSKSVYDYIGTLNSLTGDIEYGNFKLIGNYTITSATDTTVKELIPFTGLLNSEGNMVSNNGLIALKKGKTYKITSAIRTNDVSSTDNGFIEFSLYDNKGNLLKQGIANNGIIIRGNYPINYIITPNENISIGIYITHHSSPIKMIVGDNRSYLTITEIPNPTSIMNVTDNHIKEVANTYSTNETIIGKWIDGKPIYRKVITTNSTQIDVSSFNIENVSDVRYFVKTTGNYIFPGAYGYASNNMIALYFINGYSQMSIGFARPDNFSSATIILEYTKTTD